MIEDLSAASGSMVRRSSVAVIGSGPAGVTVALELARRGVEVLTSSSGSPGYIVVGIVGTSRAENTGRPQSSQRQAAGMYEETSS